ncbi:hypothetical protein R3W88_003708 [Solanum pinnatisectum]|uniref:MADS-box domain-containing protein n=1 Tax=Solanum pinnatisectum TaxID=50273 RepID=A0AAV9MQE7_9SOLN|nr:hypothetical protein R3W88_003708 [Solanum pinnatisectum]
MTRNIALIENITKRKISFKERHKTFLKKASELRTICDVELAIIVNSPDHDEPKVFPNHDDVISSFEKFRDFPAKSRMTQRVNQAKYRENRRTTPKGKKKNSVEEFTNKMYEVLNKNDIPTDIHPYDLNELSNVINQNLKKTNSEEPKALLSAPLGAPVSMVPLVAPSPVPSGTNLEGHKNPLFVPIVTPISMVPSIVFSVALTQVPQSMFHSLITISQTIPFVDHSWGCHPPLSFSSQMFPPMIPQMYPSIPQQMDFRRPPEFAPSISPMSSSIMMAPPMFPLMTLQVEPLINNIPQMDALMPMNNDQNYFIGDSQMLDWSVDDIIALCDDLPFNNNNVPDPNNTNTI